MRGVAWLVFFPLSGRETLLFVDDTGNSAVDSWNALGSTEEVLAHASRELR